MKRHFLSKNKLKLFSILVTLYVLLFSLMGCLDDSKKSSSKPQVINHNFEGKVIIIGAGAAGLAAANVLHKNSVDFTILEATDHYGGRIQKNDTFADFPIDLGAEWIHADKSILNELAGLESNSPPFEVIPFTPYDIYYLSDDTYSKAPESEIREFYARNLEYKFKRTTWFDYIEQYFAQNVSSKIVYNKPVVSINYSKDTIIVTTQDGTTYSADKVISTVSIGVLKKQAISFIPELSIQKKHAINSVVFHPGFKLFLKFNQDFYPDMIEVDTSSGEKTFYDVAYGKESSSHIFGLLSTGESALEYYRLGSEQNIVNTVIAELDTLFAGKASQHYTGEYLLQDWGQHEYTAGTWTADFDIARRETLNSSLNNKVYFAGETHDNNDEISTVQGAILSGFDIAREVIK